MLPCRRANATKQATLRSHDKESHQTGCYTTRGSDMPTTLSLPGRQGDRATGRQGDRATGPQGHRATGPQGHRATGPQGHRATGPQGDRATGHKMTTPPPGSTYARLHGPRCATSPPTLLSMRVVRRGGYDTRKTGWETTIWKGYYVPDGKVTYPQEPFLSRTHDHTAGRPTQAWVRLQDWWMARPRARNTADAHQPTCGTVRQQAGRTPRRTASLSYSSMIPHSSYRPQNHSSTTLTSTT